MALVDGTLRHEIANDYRLSSYYPAYVRQLTVPDGRLYFVIVGFGRPQELPPAHCLPARARQELAAQERRRLAEPVYCIISTHNRETTPISTCVTFAAIPEGGSLFTSTVVSGEHIIELVPDGVASVRTNYGPSESVVATVHENAFFFSPAPVSIRMRNVLDRLRRKLVEPKITEAQRRRVTLQYNRMIAKTEPTSIEWRDNLGRRVRVIKPVAGGKANSVGNLRTPIEG